MADEDEVLNQPNEDEEEQQPSPPPEEQPEEQEPEAEEPEGEPEKEEPEEEPEEEEQPVSRREKLRIVQVLNKRKEAEEQPEKQTNIDYRKMIDADDEVYEKLEKESQSYGAAQYNEGLRKAEAIQFQTRLEMDAPRIEAKYKQFNKDSDEFNPSLADAINTMYLQTVGYDPKTGYVQNDQVRYADYVEGIMELAEAAAGEKIQRSTKNIAKQASQTGIRPDGSTAKRLDLNKAPKEMTDEELDAVIAASLPTK